VEDNFFSLADLSAVETGLPLRPDARGFSAFRYVSCKLQEVFPYPFEAQWYAEPALTFTNSKF
jgi:hypothetical protein